MVRIGCNMEFKDKVKLVRKKLLITQEQLAKELGCTPLTIVRWENGQMLPRLLLEAKFEKFCEKNGVKFDV